MHFYRFPVIGCSVIEELSKRRKICMIAQIAVHSEEVEFYYHRIWLGHFLTSHQN